MERRIINYIISGGDVKNLEDLPDEEKKKIRELILSEVGEAVENVFKEMEKEGEKNSWK